MLMRAAGQTLGFVIFCLAENRFINGILYFLIVLFNCGKIKSLFLKKIHQERNKFFPAKQGSIIEKLEGSGSKLMIQLATEKEASSWLTSLQLKEYGYVLNKQ